MQDPRLALSRLVLVVAVASSIVACKKASAGYCTDDSTCLGDEHCDVANMICISDFAPDAQPVPCDVDHPCNAQGPLPFCDELAGVCVVCGDGGPSACPETAPFCADHTCVGCQLDSQCSSEVCMEDGSCADEAHVRYAAPAPDGLPSNPCTKAQPCDLATAVALVGTVFDIVHLAPGTHTILSGTGLSPTTSSTFIGRGAEVEFLGAGNAPVFNLTAGGMTYTFAFVTIKGGRGAAPGHGINCASGVSVIGRQIRIGPNDASGIRADDCDVTLTGVRLSGNVVGLSGSMSTVVINDSIIRDNIGGISFAQGDLTVRRSIVASNLSGGGISASDSAMTIENNLIVRNGGGGSSTGGMTVDGNGGTRTIRFNTFADNTASGGTAIDCGGGAIFLASSNIIDGTVTVGFGPCAMEYSLFTGAALAGTGNFTAADPLYIGITVGDPYPAGFYRIQPTSPARNVGEDTVDVPDDIDGEIRPEGALPDIGADERH